MHTTNIYKKTKTNELSIQLKILVTEQQEKKKKLRKARDKKITRPQLKTKN